MKYHVLASGSKGNCCVISSKGVSIAIDCGMTQKYLKASFDEISVDYQSLDALLITHDHSDHTKQLKMFKDIEIYSPSTLLCQFERVVPYQSFIIGHLHITPIVTSHDAEESVGYVINDGETKLVYITDTGYIREKDLELLQDADHYIIESNHDPMLLMLTPRPYYIKQRILSDTGHLSNDETGVILSKVVSDNTKSIVLAHMSLEANSEEIAKDTIMKYIDIQEIELKVAKQYEIVSGGHYE